MRGVAVALLACGLLPAQARGQDVRYEITHYDVVIQLADGTADARVEMDITYRVLRGVKTDGFKYTGEFEPVEVSAADEAGGALPVRVRREREYRVSWSFPPVPSGSYRVFVRFRLRDVLSGTRAGGNELAAPWIGVFRAPVRRAAYTIVFPPRFSPELEGRLAREFTRRTVGGRQMLTLIQEPLERTSLSLRFKPGLVDWQRPPARGLPESWPVVAMFGAAMAGLAIASAWKFRGRDGMAYTGGCGGGGCGGGCGGGGCGGGCGG